MSALGAGDDTVGAHDHVAVEVHVHLKGSEDDEIKLVDIGALVEGVRVLARGDVEVVRVAVNGADGVLVEVLGIHQLVDQSLFQKLAHRLRDAADAEAHVDAALPHDLREGDGGGDGSAADTGLIGEALLEVGRADHEVRAVLRHQELSLVGGGLCSAGRDLGGISDLIHDHDVVHVSLGDLRREVREGNQAVRHRHDSVGELGIDRGIGKNAAVCLAAVGCQVAVFIRRGGADERDVHVGLAALDGADSSAVGSHVCQALQLACGDRLTDLAADAGGLDVDDGAVLDQRKDRVVLASQGGCAEGDVLDAHLMHFQHDHIQDLVAVPEVMVEAQGHSVLDAALLQGFPDASDQLGAIGVDDDSGLRAVLLEFGSVKMMRSLIDFLAGDL